MFTGIVEAIGEVIHIEKDRDNLLLSIRSGISHELKIDQSVSHNGICLTVTALEGDVHKVTAVKETLNRTNLGNIRPGDRINLERCMPANGRFDGHVVQGHVDCIAKCTDIKEEGGSWKCSFQYSYPGMTVEKGSIAVNGCSLTVVDSHPDSFSVAVIPYTFENTVFKYLKTADTVNLEFDILGKYILKALKERAV